MVNRGSLFMFRNAGRKNSSRPTAKGRSFAALLCVLTLSLSAAPTARADSKNSNIGKEIGYFSPSDLAYSCKKLGGVYSPPSAGGTYVCLLPDKSIVCTSAGSCTMTFSKHDKNKLGLQNEAQIDRLLNVMITIQLGQLTTQLSALQDLLVEGEAPNPDLLALPNPATPGPAGYCRRDDQGRLHVQIFNEGAADADESVTRVEFGCGNPQLCNGPMQLDVATPELPKLGGTAEAVFDIPGGCFSPNTLNCDFVIRADVGNTVMESDEANNDKAGVCGPQFQ